MNDSKNVFHYTEEEKKIRKRWLIFSIGIPAFFVACFLMMGLFMLVKGGKEGLGAALLIGGVVAAAVGMIYLNYHCSYKKPGTVLLLLHMILVVLTSLGACMNIGVILANPQARAQTLFLAISMGYFLLVLAFNTAVFFYSSRLRDINRKRKEVFSSSAGEAT